MRRRKTPIRSVPPLGAAVEGVERGERLGVGRVEREHLVVAFAAASTLARRSSMAPSRIQ
jgi:hypothetical protein